MVGVFLVGRSSMTNDQQGRDRWSNWTRRRTSTLVDWKRWATGPLASLFFSLSETWLEFFLVGGLEHFLFSIYWEKSSQLTFIFFRRVGIPPTSNAVTGVSNSMDCTTSDQIEADEATVEFP